MKRKLLFLATFVASALGMRAQSWTDVTSTYLKNADLVSDKYTTANSTYWPVFTTGRNTSQHPKNWYLHTYQTQNNQFGSNYFEVWKNTSMQAGIFQDVTLPAGKYQFEGRFSTNQSSGKIVSLVIAPHHTYTSSGITASNWGSWEPQIVEFSLYEETKVRVGAYSTMFMQINGFSLRTISTTDFLQSEINDAPASLSTEVEAAQAVLDDTGADDAARRTAAKTLHDAVLLYNIENASSENPIDLTDYIINPSFEGIAEGTLTGEKHSATGWTHDTPNDQGARAVTSNGYRVVNADGFYIFNIWGGSSMTVKQVISGLPAGKYKLSAMYGSDANNSATLYIGTTQKVISTTSDKTNLVYGETDTYVLDHGSDVEIGLTSTSWFKADDFKLTYLGIDTDALDTQLNNLKTEAAGYLANADYNNVVGEERTSLSGASSITVSEAKLSAYVTAINDVQTRINTFVAAKTTYDALVSEIAHAKDLGVETATADGFAATSTSTVESINSTNLPGLNVAEYSAVNTNYTETVTLNSWTEDFNEDLNGEGYVADGVKYWNEWGSATRTGKQTLTLPAGDYAVTCIGRGNNGTSGYLYYKIGDADAVTVAFNMKGNRGKGVDTSGAANFSDGGTYNCNNEGFGWEYRYLNFHLDAEASVEIGVSATFSNDWVSIYAPKVLTTLASVKNVALTQITAALATVPADDMNATVKSTLDSKVAAAEAASMSNTKEELATILSELNDAITAANSSVAEYNKIKDYLTTSSTNVDGDYSSISAAITAGIYENSVDGMVAVKALRNTIATTSMAAGKDLTGLIDNNSFETGNTNYWTTTASDDTGARDASNAKYSMSNSDGSYLFNTWWQGTPITQNIGTLPAGAYELKGVVASNGGTIYITMNDKHEAFVETVDAAGVGIEFAYTFTLDSEQEVTIGVVGGGKGSDVKGAHKPYQSDGYWFYKVDNFRLKYLGATAPENTIDGTYYLSIGENYIGRGGDSGTEAAMKAEANSLPIQIVTDKAGISTLQMVDTRNYLFYSTSQVYTDGTIDPAKVHHKPYWKVTAVDGGYQILNTESGKYLTTVEVDRDGETLVASCSDTPATWTFTDFAALDYSTLADEITAAETHTVGYKAGEYATYTNADALTKLAQAKDLYDNQKAITQDQIATMVTTLKGALWTVNAVEVNAIENGDLEETYEEKSGTGVSSDRAIYVPNGWTVSYTGNSNDMTALNASDKAGETLTGKISTLTTGGDNTYMYRGMWGDNTNIKAYQNITLPAGTYKLTCDAWKSGSGGDATIYAGTASASLPTSEASWRKLSLVFTLAEKQTVEVGFTLIHNSNESEKLLGFDNFELYSFAEIDENTNYTPVAGTVHSLSLTRTIKEGYNTLVLPFDLTQAEVETAFGAGSVVYTVDDSQSTSSSIYFATNDGITANSPVLLKATAAGTSYDFNNVTIKSGTPTLAGTNVSFIGSYAASTDIVKDANNYIISGGKLYLVDSDGIFVKGTRAYFNVPSASAAKMIGVSFEDGETTSIEELMNSNGNILKGEVYDLQGRRVATPTRGLYIIGGKKVFIK